MREILFRGQTRRKGEMLKNVKGDQMESNWVYGGIFMGQGDFSVIYTYDPIEKRPVYSDTVGQYMGLTDKNGNKIFEGDIVEGLSDFGFPIKSVVAFDKGSFGLKCKQHGHEFFHPFTSICNVEYEVIGNIHDNPELLKK